MATDSESRINEAEISQPVCTAVQIGLTNILRRYGVRVSGVVGHSSGEIAAAYAAGAFPASTAILIAYHRGQSTKDVGNGAMAAIGLGRGEMEPWLRQGAVIACDNSPSSTTISGDTAAVDQTLEDVKAAYPDVFCKRLRVNKAYHSRRCPLTYAPRFLSLLMILSRPHALHRREIRICHRTALWSAF